MTVAELKKSGLEILLHTQKGSTTVTQTPELDIVIFLSFILGTNKSFIMAHPEKDVSQIQAKLFFEAIDKRKEGLPVAYITRNREFWGLPFFVTPSVLIPKADTEILVERAIQILEIQKNLLPRPPQVLDICTGSGCIAIALKHTIPEIIVTATDISLDALSIAKQNSELLVNDTITFLQEDLSEGIPSIPGKWDLIVSNPPYVPSTIASELLEDGRNEPILALDGGKDGLDLVRALIPHAYASLATNGYILIETGEYNAQMAATYLKREGFVDIVIHTDLENQDRVVEGKKQ